MSTKRNWRTEPGFRKVDKSSLFFQQEDLLNDEEISVRKISEFGNATEFGNAFPILAVSKFSNDNGFKMVEKYYFR